MAETVSFTDLNNFREFLNQDVSLLNAWTQDLESECSKLVNSIIKWETENTELEKNLENLRLLLQNSIEEKGLAIGVPNLLNIILRDDSNVERL